MELLKSVVGVLVFQAFTTTTPPAQIKVTDEKTFKGTTPCAQLIRPFLNIAAETDCALIKWELTLVRDPVTHQPATYRLTAVSHFIMPDNSYSQTGTKSESAGDWRIAQGTGTRSGSAIYELHPGQRGTVLRFVKLSEDVIHLLDGNNRYMTGDPFQSYTLYGIDK